MRINQAISNIDSNFVLANKIPKLSNKEMLCLYLTYQGKSSRQIANILNISIFTVNTYKRRIMTKFQCKTMSVAIFKCVECGYLKSDVLDKLNLS